MSSAPGNTDYAAWRGRLASGLCPQFWTIEWLDARLDEGTAWYFATDKAAMVVELEQFPTGAVAVKVIVAAGSKKEMREVLGPSILEWGAAHGASWAMIQSRPGWGRAMRDQGFQVFQTIVAKEL